MLSFGEFEFDAPRRLLLRSGSAVHLTPKAFDLLSLLVAAAPRVIEKSQLHERLWPKQFVSDAALIALVKELRTALEDRDKSSPIIRTVHRVGYAFEAAPSNAGSPQVLAGCAHWLAQAALIWPHSSVISDSNARIAGSDNGGSGSVGTADTAAPGVLMAGSTD